jgi:hypothetical protein
MGRWITVLSTALVVGVATVGVAGAGVPNPSLSTVPNITLSPDGSLPTLIVVVGDEGAIDTALVQVVFSTETAGIVCWCTGQTQPLIQGQTNASGEVTFFVAGGGCVDPVDVGSPPAVEVFANGVLLAEVGTVSVDAVDDAGLKPTEGWDPGVICTAGLIDATTHTPPIAGGFYSYCSDLDSDLDCDLEDAVAITPGLKNGITCTRAP